MRTTSLLVFLTVLAVASGQALAAVPETTPVDRGLRTERAAGFTAGAIGGIGFAYRRFTSDGWGWQLGGLAALDRSDRLVILGGQRMKSLNVRQRSRFYALAGAMGILNTDRFDEMQPASGAPAGSPPVFVRRSRNEASFNVGGGLGISYETDGGVGFVLELPLVFEFQHGLESVGPIPQAALLYHF
ncbi:MAG: hypothetical protein HY303_10980 [Candidatus Wallbacteria bacterium]|nr:hypothetical protein [Candidatus Wallbacteria bacterium]